LYRVSPVGAPIRVLIADDHPVYLDGLAAAVAAAPDFEVVATCPDGVEALERIEADTPDVALLDLHMPEPGAQAVLSSLSDGERRCAVIVLTVEVDGGAVHDCLSRGASGYLTKDVGADEICRAIRAVAEGGSYLSSKAQASVTAELRTRHANAPQPLSPRETEILELLATGASAPEIANRLFLSPSTVKTYLHHLYEKLGVSDRAAAVAVGLRRGLIG
jgi:two-component system, NarL family, nitrate/nitrite response regulator NarL